MNPKLMTAAAWKPVSLKFKIEDNGLQAALADYEKIKTDEHKERLAAIAEIKQLAAELKKDQKLPGSGTSSNI